MTKYTTKPIGEVADIRRGASPRPIDDWMAERGIPWVKISDATKQDSRFIYSTEGFIREEGKNKSVEVYPEDLIISNSATPGLPRIMKIHACIHDGWLLAENFRGVTRDYLLYQVKYLRKYLVNQGNGSIFTNLKTDILKEFPIQIPIDDNGNLDEDAQNQIVKVLTDIEDKIENNTAICSDLEAMAKLLYDYWFVQFDFPDENGKPYKSSGGKMVWNDEVKREIPEGWEVKPLREVISVIRGISYSPKDELQEPTKSSIRLLKSNNIQSGQINYEQPVILPKSFASDEQWLSKGSVFITMSSGSKAHMGKTAIVYNDIPHVFGAFCAKISIIPDYKCFISTYLRSEYFRAYIENVTLGTSINNISNEHLNSIVLPFPSQKILAQFEAIVDKMFEVQGKCIDENHQLASLRDFLLPMLMNGQVTVKGN